MGINWYSSWKRTHSKSGTCWGLILISWCLWLLGHESAPQCRWDPVLVLSQVTSVLLGTNFSHKVWGWGTRGVSHKHLDLGRWRLRLRRAVSLLFQLTDDRKKTTYEIILYSGCSESLSLCPKNVSSAMGWGKKKHLQKTSFYKDTKESNIIWWNTDFKKCLHCDRACF